MRRRVATAYAGDTPLRLRRFVAAEWGAAMPEAGFRFWEARAAWQKAHGHAPDMDEHAYLSLPDGPFRMEEI